MFKLNRPCVNCPFRKGQGELYQLHPQRLEEITRATAFQCHKTVQYLDDDGCGDGVPGDKPQQCAGLMALLHRCGIPNQIMQVGERLNAFDPTKLDPDHEAYETLEEMYEAHGGG